MINDGDFMTPVLPLESRAMQLEKWDIAKGRFEVRIGKFGCYIYDTKLKHDVPLTTVIIRLNKPYLLEKEKNCNECSHQGNELYNQKGCYGCDDTRNNWEAKK